MQVHLESDILLRLKKDDPQVFKIVFNKYYQPVLSNIKKFVTDEHSAEDLLQETFVAFWEKRHTFNDVEHIARWLFSVSYNKAMSFLKKQLGYTSIDEISSSISFAHGIQQDNSYL